MTRTAKDRVARALRVAWLALGLAGVARAEEPAPELWFSVGEKLIYQIHWGVIPVGRTTATTFWREEDGRRRLVIQFRTRTNRFMEKIYPVDDFLETVLDPISFLPVRFSKQLSEGRYRADEVTEFDHRNRRATWRSNKSGRTAELEIEPDTRDVNSFMYYMRARRLKVGEVTRHRVMADEKVYDLFVKALKVENVKVPGLGRMPSVKVEPEAAFHGLFVRKGRVWMWVSDDDRRFCTRLIAQVPVANVSLLLRQVSYVEDEDSTGDGEPWEDEEENEAPDELEP